MNATVKTAMNSIKRTFARKNTPKLLDVIITSDNLVGFCKSDGSYRCMTPKVAAQGIR